MSTLTFTPTFHKEEYSRHGPPGLLRVSSWSPPGLLRVSSWSVGAEEEESGEPKDSAAVIQQRVTLRADGLFRDAA